MSTVTVKKSADAALDENEATKSVTIAVAKTIKSEQWKNKAYSIDELFAGLSAHRTLEDKNNAAAFAQGSLIRNIYNRNKENFLDVNLFILDIDNKVSGTKTNEHFTVDNEQHVSLDKATSLIEASNYAAIVYTSHSHTEKTHRFRVVFPMANAYGLDTDAAKYKWEFYYQAISAKLGFGADERDGTAEKYSQAFYMPSCPKENLEIAKSFVVNKDGGLLDWQSYEDEASRLAITGSHSSTGTEHYIYDDFFLPDWYDVYGGTFPVTKALESGEFDVIGKQNNDGGFCLESCPFHEEHSDQNPTETKTAIYNPDGKGRQFDFNCFGDACSSKIALDYLLKMLEDGWLTLEMLKDPALGGGGIDAEEEAAEADKHTTVERAKQILHLAVLDGRATVLIKIKKTLAKETDWTTTDLNALVKEIRDELEKKYEIEKYIRIINAARKMNDEFIAVSIGNRMRYIRNKHGSDVFFTRADLMNYLEATYVEVRVYDSKQSRIVTEKVALGKIWVAWEGRREADEVVMLPAPPNVKPKIEPYQYNLWRGFTVKPVKGDWSLLQGHILHIVCNGNKEHYHWIMAWFAQMFQQPQVKPETAIVLKGKKGTGKSIIGDQIRKIVGDYHSFLASDSKHITGNFNNHLAGNIFLQAEEAVWAGDKKGKGALQNLITGPTIALEPKNVDVTNIANFTRVFMTTNEDFAIPATHGERRYGVWELIDEKMQDTTYFGALADQMNNGGRAAMLYDLLEYDIEDFDLRTAPKTEALLKQIEQGEPLEIQWLKDILHNSGHTDGLYVNPWHLNEDVESHVIKDDVYNSYKLYVKEHAKSHYDKPMADNIFAKWLINLMGVKTQRKPRKNEYFYIFPSLKDMDVTMKRKFKHEVTRPEIVDEETANDNEKSNDVDLSNLQNAVNRNKR